MREIKIIKTQKVKFEFIKFLELVPVEAKMPNYVTAARIKNILEQLSRRRVLGNYQCDSAMEQT